MRSLLVSLILVTMAALGCSHCCNNIYDAAKEGDAEKVKLFLTANPNLINATNYDRGWTPLLCVGI